ncbi:MAG: hypothetical protein EON84_09560 [Bradyrhizobiaceae bacterium]|jgi:hypothetical protein|nr:MAG: hypothetical protein EON84_09560 [Bradyrhizobiaceae bacterium]
MPHYYFDIKNGLTTRDHVGGAYEREADALMCAFQLATRLASEPAAMPACERVVCLVREDGHEVVRIPVAASAVFAGSASRAKELPQQFGGLRFAQR